MTPRCRNRGIRRPGYARGVTLLELLIALTVMGILSALAWPGYSAIMLRTQRHDAQLALLDLQHAQERHYLRHFQYTDLLTEAPAEGGLGRGERSDGGEYRLSVTLHADGQGYTAHAFPAPESRQGRDRTCARFSLDHTGRHAATDVTGSDTTRDCWR